MSEKKAAVVADCVVAITTFSGFFCGLAEKKFKKWILKSIDRNISAGDYCSINLLETKQWIQINTSRRKGIHVKSVS